MKVSYLSLFALLMLLSCKKLEELTTFRFKDSTSFTLPGTVSIGALPISTVPVESNSKFEFENNNTNVDNIKEATLDKLSLTIESPSEQTFDFLNSIRIYISAEGLDEKEIAFLDSIPANVSTIELQTTGVILTDYIKKTNYSIRVNAVTDQILEQDTKIRADMEFLVKAKLL